MSCGTSIKKKTGVCFVFIAEGGGNRVGQTGRAGGGHSHQNAGTTQDGVHTKSAAGLKYLNANL